MESWLWNQNRCHAQKSWEVHPVQIAGNDHYPHRSPQSISIWNKAVFSLSPCTDWPNLGTPCRSNLLHFCSSSLEQTHNGAKGIKGEKREWFCHEQIIYVPDFNNCYQNLRSTFLLHRIVFINQSEHVNKKKKQHDIAHYSQISEAKQRQYRPRKEQKEVSAHLLLLAMGRYWAFFHIAFFLKLVSGSGE